MTRGKKKGRGRGRGRGSSLRQRLDDADAFAASFGAPPAPPMPTGTSLRASQVDRAVAADMLGAAIDVMDIDVDNEGELTPAAPPVAAAPNNNSTATGTKEAEQPERCCARNNCTFHNSNPPLPLRNDFVHQCRHTGCKTHAPCGEEVVVEGRSNNQGGVVKVISSGATFPIDRLGQVGLGDSNGAVDGFSEICSGCLPGLLEGSSDGGNNASRSGTSNQGRTNEEELGNNASRGTSRTNEEELRLRALFKAIYPNEEGIMHDNVDIDVVEDMIDNAKEGNAGIGKEYLYRQHVGGNRQSARPTNNAPSTSLQAIRAQVHPEGMLRNSRAKSSQKTVQAENIKLILWLHFNKPEMIADAFNRELDDINASVDYTHITHPPRRRRYRGKKSVPQRKAEHRIKMLAVHVSEALGQAGTFATTCTVNLDAFTADAHTFAEYLASKRKANDCLMKPGVYEGYRSSLTNFFRRYRFIPPEQYKSDLKVYLDGMVRLANEANQNGEVRYYDYIQLLCLILLSEYCCINHTLHSTGQY